METGTPEILDEEAKIEKLTTELMTNNRLLKHANDPKRIVVRGLLYGLSTIIGATILVALGYTFVKNIPFLGDKIEKYLPTKIEVRESKTN